MSFSGFFSLHFLVFIWHFLNNIKNIYTPIFIGLDTLWHPVIKLQSCFVSVFLVVTAMYWTKTTINVEPWHTLLLINTWVRSVYSVKNRYVRKQSGVFRTNWYNPLHFCRNKSNMQAKRSEVLTSHSGSAPSVWMSSRWKTLRQVDVSGRSVETLPFLLRRADGQREGLTAAERPGTKRLVFQRTRLYKQIYKRTGGAGFIRVISPHPGKKVSSVPACAGPVRACVLKLLKSCTPHEISGNKE